MADLKGRYGTVLASTAIDTCEGEVGSCTVDKQIQRLQHGVSGNLPLEGADKHEGRQFLESDEPFMLQDKAAHSCSRDLWKESNSRPVETASVTENMPGCKQLEASLMPPAGSKDVWVADQALAEAISAGMSKSRSLKLVVRGPDSTGYRVEAVSVEQLQDVWHPMEWGGSVEVCSSKDTLKRKAHEEAGDDLDGPSPKKQRHVWTSEAHHKFMSIVEGLGDRAVPMRILNMMRVDGLTREQVASHLQKYRMHAKEQPQEEACKQGLAQVSQALGGDGLDSMLRNLGNVGFQAMLEASGMAKQFHTISGTDGLAGAKQQDTWRALSRPGAGSNSFPSISPPGCPSLQTPRCEGQAASARPRLDTPARLPEGSQVEAVDTDPDPSGVSTQHGPSIQPDLATTTIPDRDRSKGDWIDSTGDQKLDDLLNSFTLPQEL